MDGFKNMIRAQILCSGEVGNGTGDFENAVVGAGREVELLHGLFKEHGAFFRDDAVLAHDLGAHVGVGAGHGKAEKSGFLKIATVHDALANGGGRFGFLVGCELFIVNEGDFDVEVDAVEEGAGNLGAIGFNLARAAAALTDRVSIKPTRAGI